MCDGVEWLGDDNDASEDNDDVVDEVVVDDDNGIWSLGFESIKLSRSSKSNCIRSMDGLKIRLISLLWTDGRTGCRTLCIRPSCIFDKCGDFANVRRLLLIVRWTLNLPVFKLS